jgi:putative phosphoribosyl transferase
MERKTERRSVQIDAGMAVTLNGDLTVPAEATGIVLFAHGSGSSRHSPRNQYVARILNDAGLATLLMDLLTLEEESVDVRTGHLRFDVGLLAERLVAALDWMAHEDGIQHLNYGLFGASTGAGAALVAAAQRPSWVSAVVSRGGRPDLAGAALPNVRAPTLLIVGELDTQVIALNRQAQAQLQVANRLEIVPGASHLFEEPGTLDIAAALARDWFLTHPVLEQT